MENSEKIGRLLFRYTRKELTADEEKELTTWRYVSQENENLFQQETDPEFIRTEFTWRHQNKDLIFKKIQSKYPQPWAAARKRSLSNSMPLIRIAAILILILAPVLYLFLSGKLNRSKTDPGNRLPYTLQQACLVSPDDVARALDDMNRGWLAGSAGISFKTDENGDLIYITRHNPNAAFEKLYKLYTPPGGHLHLELPDGSRVWLNARTSIQYPANFSNDTLKYIVNGEAYFELGQNATKTRIISILSTVNRQPSAYLSLQINSSSARFNIESYPDEPTITTTLLEGNALIRLNAVPGAPASETQFLAGQQARVTESGVTVIPAADINEVIDWKNGRTSFRDADIPTLMREISRLYGVEIRYKGRVPDKKFSFSVPRNSTLSRILPIMEHQGIHFSVEGKTITVSQ